MGNVVDAFMSNQAIVLYSNVYFDDASMLARDDLGWRTEVSTDTCRAVNDKCLLSPLS